MNWINSIDWAATGTMLQGIGTLAGVGAVVMAAHVGANAWRQQKLAERRLDFAERILTAAHKARSGLAFVRSPLMSGGELEQAKEQLVGQAAYHQMRQEKKNRARMAQAYANRLVSCRAEIEAIEDCLPLARVMFSGAVEQALSDLRQQFHIVRTMHGEYVDDWDGRDAEFTAKIRRAMYDIEPADGSLNEVSEAIKEAVRTIESAVEPALRLAPVAAPRPSTSSRQ